jgi:hypothetical protein
MPSPNSKTDQPLSFGYKCAWYAVRTNDVDAVVDALELREVVDAWWHEGIQAAYADNVFVTPPLGPWILAAGWCLHYRFDSPPSVEPLLTKLSRHFGEAQYFCTHRVPEAHCWALAHSGKLVRAYGYIGERGEITWNYGTPTTAELALGQEVLDFPGPSESHVMEVAAAWSINPSELETNFGATGAGRIGIIAW